MYSYVVRQVEQVAMETMWTQVDGIDRGRKLRWLGWFHGCVLPKIPGTVECLWDLGRWNLSFGATGHWCGIHFGAQSAVSSERVAPALFPPPSALHDRGVYRRCLCQVFPAASCLLNKLHLASL